MSATEKRADPGESAASPAFECRSVTVEFLHKFSRKRIIEDISFLVRSGEFVTIVGILIVIILVLLAIYLFQRVRGGSSRGL